jgi:hypothetical protein
MIDAFIGAKASRQQRRRRGAAAEAHQPAVRLFVFFCKSSKLIGQLIFLRQIKNLFT